MQLDIQQYRDAIEQVGKYNSRISSERKQRFPYIDAQTGVAQRPSNLWFAKYQRMKGTTPQQLYTYPAKRWKVKRRPFRPSPSKPYVSSGKSIMVDFFDNTVASGRNMDDQEIGPHEITSAENPIAALRTNDDTSQSYDYARDDEDSRYYFDDEDFDDSPDTVDYPRDDDSDYEDTIKHRTKKTKGTKRSRKHHGTEKSFNASLSVDDEKCYSCSICGKKYMTSTGLKYHYAHAHEDEDAAGSHSNSPSISRSSGDFNFQRQTYSPAISQTSGLILAQNLSDDEVRQRQRNTYCDFCLGDIYFNKKTKQPEELISCSDCGRSGHPSCLQFTRNMMISCKKYKWQCIECKCCWKCGTQDNDDKILFCDDCDRGYHMYCLTPPLSEPPEGNWSCTLCLAEFHGINSNQIKITPATMPQNISAGYMAPLLPPANPWTKFTTNEESLTETDEPPATVGPM